MAFDTGVPLNTYKNLFNNYLQRIESIQKSLNQNFNFNLHTTDTAYYDFWGILTDVNNLSRVSFSSTFSSIISKSQTLNDLLETKYLDFVGMMMSLDNYICYSTDAFSRISDSIWAFGDGSIYRHQDGGVNPDGSVKLFLEDYYDEIIQLISDMELCIQTNPGITDDATLFGIDTTKITDNTYLTYKRDNFFLPKIRRISSLLELAINEVNVLLAYLDDTSLAINVWFIESFKLVSYTNLIFNLPKKAERVANKIITMDRSTKSSGMVSSPISRTNVIAANQAKFWKTKILSDQSNRYQCLNEAILAGLDSLGYAGSLKSYIDQSWERMVLKYG